MQHPKDAPRRLPRRAALGAALAAATVVAVPARGGATTDWPVQPVRYINLFPPGGATDIMSRLFCAAMSQVSGQQWVVENRVGAAGNVGTAAIAQARPDGYTLGLGSVATLSIARHLYANLPFDPARDFTFITGIWQVANLLFVNNDLPARTLPELLALLRANPGRYRYGSGGSGTTPHLTMEWLKRRAGFDAEHVVYRGGAPALVDLLGGRIQLMFDNIPTAIGAVRDGRVRAIAVTSRERNPALPEVPALAETFPGFEITSWGGLVGPTGIPWPVVERANALARRALSGPDLIRGFAENGATPWWTTPEDLASFRAQQDRHFAELVRISGARVD
jgi:tripartite-type tricarboxylate transporter receptor subunit TctC